MCHEYGMRWWRSERDERKRTEEPKADLMGIFAVSQPAEAPSTAGQVEEKKSLQEKELVPAKEGGNLTLLAGMSVGRRHTDNPAAARVYDPDE